MTFFSVVLSLYKHVTVQVLSLLFHSLPWLKLFVFALTGGSTTLIKKNAFFHIVVRGRVREERAREILLYVYVWILFYIYMDILSSAT